ATAPLQERPARRAPAAAPAWAAARRGRTRRSRAARERRRPRAPPLRANAWASRPHALHHAARLSYPAPGLSHGCTQPHQQHAGKNGDQNGYHGRLPPQQQRAADGEHRAEDEADAADRAPHVRREVLERREPRAFALTPPAGAARPRT